MSNLWSRKSNVLERSVDKAPKSFPLLTHFSIFLTFSNCNVEYYSLSEIRIDILRKHCQRKQIFEQTLSFQTFSLKLEVYELIYSLLLTLSYLFCVLVWHQPVGKHQWFEQSINTVTEIIHKSIYLFFSFSFFQYVFLLKVKKPESCSNLRYWGSFIYDTRKKSHKFWPTQEPCIVYHPSVLQWTYGLTYFQKMIFLNFFEKH